MILLEKKLEKFYRFDRFTRYEMGVYDQPAIVDYILAKTNASKLYYIGYSQGTTSLLVMLSERPEYNDKIYAASLMAPVGYIYDADSIYKLGTIALPLLRVTINTKIIFEINLKILRVFFNFSQWKVMNFYREIHF